MLVICFGSFPVRILVRRPTILIEAFCDFPHSLHTHVGILSWNTSCSLPSPSFVIINYCNWCTQWGWEELITLGHYALLKQNPFHPYLKLSSHTCCSSCTEYVRMALRGLQRTSCLKYRVQQGNLSILKQKEFKCVFY